MELEKNLLVVNLMETQVNLMDLPIEMLELVLSFLHRKHLKNFGLASKRCQQTVRMTRKKYLGFKKCVDLREMKQLNKVLSRSYISLNLNECHWMSSAMILELISKNNGVRELKLIDCACTPEVIEAVSKLNLTSLTFSLTRNWRRFFVSNEQNSIPCFKRLKKLEVFHRKGYRSSLLVSHVAQYVLRHCSNVEYLKLFTHSVFFHSPEQRYYEICIAQKISIPKLKTLILDVSRVVTNFLDLRTPTNPSRVIKDFLKLILNNRQVSLKRIDLGNLTADVILSRILYGENFFENTSELCLINDNYQLFSRWLSVNKVKGLIDSMLKSPNCKKISLEHFFMDNLTKLMEAIDKSGNTSIEHISLRGCTFVGNFSNYISAMWNIKSQITFLDIREISCHDKMDSNPELIDSLSNLTNLRTLYVDPAVFTCETGQENILKTSLENFAGKCKSLKSLCIVGVTIHRVVSEDALSRIKFFKNLRELHLVNFETSGERDALPEIAKNCSQLKYLNIRCIRNENGNRKSLEKSLVHTKRLKHLSTVFKITEELVDALTECTEIEKLYLEDVYFRSQNETIKYFADNLKKLTKLDAFITKGPPEMLQYLRTACDEIEGRNKPSFYSRKRDVPVAHLHMLQYMTPEYLRNFFEDSLY